MKTRTTRSYGGPEQLTFAFCGDPAPSMVSRAVKERRADDGRDRMVERLDYWIDVDRGGVVMRVETTITPNISARSLALMKAESADRLGLCEGCELACACHVMVPAPDSEYGPHVWEKYCTLLFFDRFRVSDWTLEEVI